MLVAVLAVMMLGVAGNDAVAGGNKAVKNGKIVIRNNTLGTVGVAVDPAATLRNSASQADFVSAGGFVLNPGEATPALSVKPGAHVLIQGSIMSGATSFRQTTVNVASAQTTTTNVSSINNVIP